MSESAKNPSPFDLLVEQIRAVVREEIERANAKRKPAKLLFDTKEAAAMLNVPDTWLASKARAGEVPYRQTGHYRSFSIADIDAIIAQFAVAPPTIPVIYSNHDGKEVQADSTQTRVEPVAACKAFGRVAEHSSALGPGRQADTGADRALHETPSRKKPEGGE